MAETSAGLSGPRPNKAVMGEILLALEARNPTQSPATSPLLNGKWKVLYATGASPGLKALTLLLKGAKQAPKSPSGADLIGALPRTTPAAQPAAASCRAALSGSQQTCRTPSSRSVRSSRAWRRRCARACCLSRTPEGSPAASSPNRRCGQRCLPAACRLCAGLGAHPPGCAAGAAARDVRVGRERVALDAQAALPVAAAVLALRPRIVPRRRAARASRHRRQAGRPHVRRLSPCRPLPHPSASAPLHRLIARIPPGAWRAARWSRPRWSRRAAEPRRPTTSTMSRRGWARELWLSSQRRCSV